MSDEARDGEKAIVLRVQVGRRCARGGARRDGWPVCAWLDGESWECVGVPLSVPGVVFSALQGQVRYSVATGTLTRPGIEEVSAADAAWGRLLIVDEAQRLANVQATARRFAAPAVGHDTDGLTPAPDIDVRVAQVGRCAFWLSGAAMPRDGWVEVAGSGFAPLRLNSSEIASTPPEVPQPAAIRRQAPQRLLGNT